MRCPRDLSDCSALFIGAATALMLPADVPYFVELSGVAFAVVVVKLPLGGTESVPFVPTAAGFAFMSLCWPDKVFSYPIRGNLTADAARGVSLSGMLHQGTAIRLNTVNLFDILTGNIPGPMGASCAIVLVTGMIYMGVRYRRAILNTLSFLVTAALFAVLLPRVYGGVLGSTSLVMELCAGSLMFASLFFVTDPAISPQKPLHRIYYGAFSALVVMLLRRWSNLEDSVCFGILISNAAWAAIEVRLIRRAKKKKKARKAKAAAAAGEGGAADA
jgi:electron transport complex protein RnfD